MAVTQGIRAGARSKFRNVKAEMNKSLANKPEGEVIEGESTFVEGEAVEDSGAREVATTTQIARPSVTTASCVKALEKAIGFGRSALYIEVSVALAMFSSSSTGADRSTKRVVMDVYAQAGFEVATTGRDYKTVNRRINASAALYDKLGSEAIAQAMHGLREGKAIESLCNYLAETHKFDSINAVLEFVGKPVEQTNTSEVRAARSNKEAAAANAEAVSINARIEKRQAERQAELLDDGIIVSAGILSIVIPRTCTAEEVRAMATKLTEFADRLAEEEGTPEEQRNSAMHH